MIFCQTNVIGPQTATGVLNKVRADKLAKLYATTVKA